MHIHGKQFYVPGTDAGGWADYRDNHLRPEGKDEEREVHAFYARIFKS